MAADSKMLCFDWLHPHFNDHWPCIQFWQYAAVHVIVSRIFKSVPFGQSRLSVSGLSIPYRHSVLSVGGLPVHIDVHWLQSVQRVWISSVVFDRLLYQQFRDWTHLFYVQQPVPLLIDLRHNAGHRSGNRVECILYSLSLSPFTPYFLNQSMSDLNVHSLFPSISVHAQLSHRHPVLHGVVAETQKVGGCHGVMCLWSRRCDVHSDSDSVYQSTSTAATPRIGIHRAL